jgi:hypothetical protein
MIFNNVWTKEINDECRNLIKKGYTSSNIIEHFGENITNSHPKKKYTYTKLLNYNNYINEIKITAGYTNYSTSKIPSEYVNKTNYKYDFIINGNKYVLLFFYVENYDMKSYELVFTTNEQFEKYEQYKKSINQITLLDEMYLSSIIEEETDRKELIKIMKSICYIIENEYKDLPFSITETDNLTKINLYRNIFNDTYKNIFIEEIGNSQLNKSKKIYYYKKL